MSEAFETTEGFSKDVSDESLRQSPGSLSDSGEEHADHQPSDPERETSPDSQEVLATEVSQAEKELIEALQRVHADFANYKKRVLNIESESRINGAIQLLRALLPALDALDYAVKHSEATEEGNLVSSSLVQVASAFNDVFIKEGIERLGNEGEEFNPSLHEAVSHLSSDGEEKTTIAEVLRSGWSYKGRVIRPAMVVVKG